MRHFKHSILFVFTLTPLTMMSCGGLDGTSVCDLASQHVAACMARPAPAAPEACSAADADLANTLLGLDCSGVRALAANTQGKADGDGCLAPWDCPEQYPSQDQPCGLTDMIMCQSHCEGLYTDPHLRLKKVSCEVLAGGVAHCQCKGYWLPWEEEAPADPEPEPWP